MEICFSLYGKSVYVWERKWVWTGSFVVWDSVLLLLLVFSDPAQPKHIKGNAKHSCSGAVSLLPWQDYSGEYLFWGDGHANCRPVVRRQRAASCQKQHVSVLTMSCFQRERGGSANPRTECLKVLYFDFPCCPVEENAKAFNRLMWNMGRAPCVTVCVCAVHHE